LKLNSLRESVYEANMELFRRGLVLYTFGNASGIDRNEGIFAIKPSGVSYAELSPKNMVLVDLDGSIVEGELRPSSDTKTHLHLYQKWSDIGGVAHTHSTYATVWAQARRSIPCLGTTHADYVNGDIPCSNVISELNTKDDYEFNTGSQIISSLGNRTPTEVPMVLVAGHGPFSWGADASKAAAHSVILEEIARMALMTHSLANGNIFPLENHLLEKHYTRKHGPQAYYGQV
jgi:L-ribulose-5-phosphate 4-epimerase